jgi:hypothetical protein
MDRQTIPNYDEYRRLYFASQDEQTAADLRPQQMGKILAKSSLAKLRDALNHKR